MATPTLNWREIARAAETYAPELEGLFVDRIIIPERPRFPGRYLKDEWLIRLGSRQKERLFIFSLRNRHPYFALGQGKSPPAASGATQSPFSLAISKHLRGAKLLKLEAFHRERMLALWFSSESGEKPQGLILSMIPATPEGLLIEEGGKVIARSRKGPEHYEVPDGLRAPPDLPLREEFFETPFTFWKIIHQEIDRESFELRARTAQKALQEVLKHSKDRIRQNSVAAREAEQEPDWQSYGDLMKASLGEPPPIQNLKRRIQDYASGEWVEIPADPKLSPQAQVEKFFQLARRKKRRHQEATNRLKDAEDTAARFEKLSNELKSLTPDESDWNRLEQIEQSAGILQPAADEKVKGSKTSKAAWSGRSFRSKDGMTIWVGRSKDENLELTFKIARGNDIWMHVRGKPGTHTVIPLGSGKSAPLETLLDAAALTVFYSGGEKWGKTEVDYTFKKYVKRIKDSTEASYINNKTLIIEPDQERLQRLLSQQSS